MYDNILEHLHQKYPQVDYGKLLEIFEESGRNIEKTSKRLKKLNSPSQDFIANTNVSLKACDVSTPTFFAEVHEMLEWTYGVEATDGLSEPKIDDLFRSSLDYKNLAPSEFVIAIISLFEVSGIVTEGNSASRGFVTESIVELTNRNLSNSTVEEEKSRITNRVLLSVPSQNQKRSQSLSPTHRFGLSVRPYGLRRSSLPDMRYLKSKTAICDVSKVPSNSFDSVALEMLEENEIQKLMSKIRQQIADEEQANQDVLIPFIDSESFGSLAPRGAWKKEGKATAVSTWKENSIKKEFPTVDGQTIKAVLESSSFRLGEALDLMSAMYPDLQRKRVGLPGHVVSTVVETICHMYNLDPETTFDCVRTLGHGRTRMEIRGLVIDTVNAMRSLTGRELDLEIGTLTFDMRLLLGVRLPSGSVAEHQRSRLRSVTDLPRDAKKYEKIARAKILREQYHVLLLRSSNMHRAGGMEKSTTLRHRMLNMAEEYARTACELKAKAVEMFLDAYNTTESIGAGVIDLHGLETDEFQDVLSEFIEAQHKIRKRIKIVVGVGSHSAGGPKLPNAVKRFLEKQTLRVMNESRCGEIMVKLPAVFSSK